MKVGDTDHGGDREIAELAGLLGSLKRATAIESSFDAMLRGVITAKKLEEARAKEGQGFKVSDLAQWINGRLDEMEEVSRRQELDDMKRVLSRRTFEIAELLFSLKALGKLKHLEKFLVGHTESHEALFDSSDFDSWLRRLSYGLRGPGGAKDEDGNAIDAVDTPNRGYISPDNAKNIARSAGSREPWLTQNALALLLYRTVSPAELSRIVTALEAYDLLNSEQGNPKWIYLNCELTDIYYRTVSEVFGGGENSAK